MRPKKFVFFPLLGVGALFLGGWAVMLLWNAILPDVTGVKTLTYWQAMGLLVLSRILFGGWRGGGRPGAYNKHQYNKHKAWRDKWMNMSMEERMKFKQEWRERCRRGKWEDWKGGKPSDQERNEEETKRLNDDELL